MRFHYIGQGELDLTLRVWDATLADDSWNFRWMHSVLSSTIVSHTVAHATPIKGVGSDRLKWKWSSTGMFSIAETYKKCLMFRARE